MNSFFHKLANAGIRVVRSGFESELSDESHLPGHADGLVRARSEQDVIALMRASAIFSVPVTIASGKTSLTGGAVPLGGILCNVRGLDFVGPDGPSHVGPGMIVRQYKEVVEAAGSFYPPDPTSQDSCTLGGNVACNASGSLSYLYGPTRDYINGLRIVLPDGRPLKLERGEVISSSGHFIVPSGLISPSDQGDLVIPVPVLNTPDWVHCKNAAGLSSSEPMDLVDLFIGSEGILGVVTGITTKLLPSRKDLFSLMLSIPTVEKLLDLVHLLDDLKRLHHDRDLARQAKIADQLKRLCRGTATPTPEGFRDITPSCMEWIGTSLAEFLSSERGARLKRCAGCLFIEQEYSDTANAQEVLSQWADLVRALNEGQIDGQTIETEVALDAAGIRHMRKDREAVPQRLTDSIRPGMVKVGLDFAVPMRHLNRLFSIYDQAFQGMNAYVFGHVGNAHLHANLLPETREELDHCRSLIKQMAREVCALGGSVSAEHGIGKLKHELLEIMLGREGITEIRRVKEAVDPRYLLNRGTMIGYVPDGT